jgi:Icc-related predicted phosphoesterase
MTHAPPHGILDSEHGRHIGCHHLFDAIIERKQIKVPINE